MKKGLLIIVSGPSGVGKGTVRRLVMADHALNMTYSVSMTTRKPREFEREGVDYFFVTQEEFDKAVKEDAFLEHVTFVDHSYGTPKEYVEKLRNEGKNVFIEIDVQGALEVLKKADGPETLSFFIVPPSIEELERRIKNRGTETEEIIQERLSKARLEISKDTEYDYIVLNDSIQSCADAIRSVILNTMREGRKSPNLKKGNTIPENLRLEF